MTHGTSFDFNGDLPMGMPITFGVQNAEHEAKDWANSRFLLLIGSNPVETRIPDVHFIFDAVERGAKLVVVDPTFSPTASKADAHLRIRPGTDAALGLALCRQVIADDAWDAEFMRTYTDAPLLVRADTGKRLREADLDRRRLPDRVRGLGHGRRRAPSSSAPTAWASPTTWRSRSRACSTVTLADGSTVEAVPGFALVRRELDRGRPKRPPRSRRSRLPTIVKLARAYAVHQARPRSSWAAAPTTGTTATSPGAPSRSWPR